MQPRFKGLQNIPVDPRHASAVFEILRGEINEVGDTIFQRRQFTPAFQFFNRQGITGVKQRIGFCNNRRPDLFD